MTTEKERASEAEAPLLMLDTGGHMAAIWDIAFTPDGRQLLSASADKTIRVWDTETGKTLRTIRGESAIGHRGKIYAAALSSNGKWLAVGGGIACVRLYHFASGKLVASLEGHEHVVLGLAFSPDGRYVISGGFDKTAIIWDVAARQLKHRLLGHGAEIYAVGFTPDSERAVTGSFDRDLRLWCVADGGEIARITGHGDKVRSLVVAPDGTVASGDRSGEIRLLDSESVSRNSGIIGTFSKLLARQEASVGSLQFSLNGKTLLSGTGPSVGGNDCHVYDIATGCEIVTYRGHDDAVIATAISPGGRWAATGGGNSHEIHVWDLHTGERRAGPGGQALTLAGQGKVVRTVGFSPNGRWIGWGSENSNLAETTPISNRASMQDSLSLPSAADALPRPHKLEEGEAITFLRAAAIHGPWSLKHRKGGSYGYNAILDIARDDKTVASIERGASDGYSHRSYSFTADGETVVSGGVNGVLTAYDRAGNKLIRRIYRP